MDLFSSIDEPPQYERLELILKLKIMSKKSTPAPKYRDADSGQYVPKKYADSHPKTTVKETEKKKK